MPVSNAGKFASLESLRIPSFELSTKDFENAFIFNDTRLPTTYEDYDTPDSPRSSIATPPASPIITPRPYSSGSRSARSSRSSSLTCSSPTSATAQPLSRSSSQRSLTATVSTTDAMRSRLSPVAEVVPAPAHPTVPRTSLDDISETSASTSADEDEALPPLPRYFSITASKDARASVAAAVKRRSLVIASSPWTCLEDAHHPLCTGECVTAASSSSAPAPSTPTSSTIAPDAPPTFTLAAATSSASPAYVHRHASLRSNASPAIPKRRSSVFVTSIARAASAFGQAYARGSVDGEVVRRRVSQ
jgi:hypothetical protein